MRPSFTIESQPVDILGFPGRLYRLEGMFASEGTEAFEADVEAANQAGIQHFVIDFSRVTYISSGILRQLLKLRRLTREHKGDVRIAALPRQIKEHVFDALGFSKVFTLYLDADEAISDVVDS